MEARDLARWTRFANKGGIGRCTAVQDCVAQGTDDLMFLTDDEIVVLMQLPEENWFLVSFVSSIDTVHTSEDLHLQGLLRGCSRSFQRQRRSFSREIKETSHPKTYFDLNRFTQISLASSFTLASPR